MAKGFKSGCSASLPAGLKIVGNPRPRNPKEGTVWANTDTEITGYVLSATALENPTAGMLWIKISDSSNVEIGTPLGKDYITIMLDSVSQYVGSAWVDVEAQSFQNGVWNEFAMYLYRNGNEYESLTGGWGSSGFSLGSLGVSTATKSADRMVLESASGKVVVASPVNLIDLNKIKSITVSYKNTKVDEYGLRLSIQPGKVIEQNAILQKTFTAAVGVETTETVEIASGFGECYIIFYTANGRQAEITSISYEAR